jgi:SAM-dependent methyltransferase
MPGMLSKEIKYDFKTHLDDPETSVQHGQIILSKLFLKKVYLEWYRNFVNIAKENPSGKYLEIGSGGGFLKDLIPNVITSDIMPIPGVDMTFSAEEMPFKNNELDGIFMVNVMHHIPRPYLFFKEAERTLKPGGKIVMVEPANTPFSKFVYQKFHHEPFEPAAGWEFTSTGPLSSSNQALPYIYLIRDREKFEKEFPSLKIEKIKIHTALTYILSGGVSRRNLVPQWSYGFWKTLERFPGVSSLAGMFGTYIISKK